MALRNPPSCSIRSPFLLPSKGVFQPEDWLTTPSRSIPEKSDLESQLEDLTEELDDLQRRLFAEASNAVLIHFQGMDAAGKDSSIREVMKGVDPAGCDVVSFKKPSLEELAHDFLWRTTCRLPERGKFGVFNRGYYEEVLIVRLHPEWLKAQKILKTGESLWKERFESIIDHEKHLARNGTVILKFFLNLSQAEQKRRFLSRLSKPRKHWKFSEADLTERGHWNRYRDAYSDVLTATHKPWAPWYCLPADNKPYLWVVAAEILVKTLKQLNPQYPSFGKVELARFEALKSKLEKQR
jgi:PPK2 family polyphosphate:nucleotide phosphotransferase